MSIGGSSSSSNTTQSSTDPEAARRMAAVAERQQAMAEEQWGIGKDVYLPYEKEMVESNAGLIGANEALMKARLEEGTYDIGQDRERRDLIRSQMLQELKDSANIPAEFYDSTDIDVNDRMAEAGADVEQAFAGTEGAWRREAGRLGLNPVSGAFASKRGKDLRSKAAALAGAKTNARRTASEDKYARLMNAMTMRQGAQNGSIDSSAYQQGNLELGGYQLTNPLDRSSSIYSNVINANAAGMKPLTQSSSSGSRWNFSTSSRRYKEDIEPLDDRGDIVDSLIPVTFKYKENVEPGGRQHNGFIAEDLLDDIPEAVVYKGEAVEGINYTEIVPVLVKALQETRKDLMLLREKFENLEVE